MPIGLKRMVGMSPRSAINLFACGQSSPSCITVAMIPSGGDCLHSASTLSTAAAFAIGSATTSNSTPAFSAASAMVLTCLACTSSLLKAMPGQPHVCAALGRKKRTRIRGLAPAAGRIGRQRRVQPKQARLGRQGRQPDGGHKVPPVHRPATTASVGVIVSVVVFTGHDSVLWRKGEGYWMAAAGILVPRRRCRNNRQR